VGIGAGALLAASSTVHHILAHIGFAPILLIAIAVLPSPGASVSAVATRADRGAVGVGGAAHTAGSAVLHILAHIRLASVRLVAVAILPSRGAHGGAHTAAAGGGSVGVGGALGAAAAAVVQVLAHIGLAPVLHVVVAILPPGLTHGLALAIGAGGSGVGVGRALGSTAAAVIHVLAHIGLAPIL
jgi:hypothetical protein